MARKTKKTEYKPAEMPRAISGEEGNLGGARSASELKDFAKPEDNMSFAQRFRMERDRQGAGGTFTWRGKSFSTKMASDAPKSAPKAARASAQTKAASAPERASASAAKPTAGSNLGSIQTKGAALRAAMSGPATPAPSKPTKPANYSLARPSDWAGKLPSTDRKLTAEQQRKIGEAQARGKSRWEEARKKVASYAKGGKIDGCAVRGKTKAMRKK